MTNQWLSKTVMKIHEGCGGLIRWVEAYDDPHTGFTGDCLECSSDKIPVERMIPVELPRQMIATDLHNQLDIEDLRDLEWNEDATFDENQEQIRTELEIEVEMT